MSDVQLGQDGTREVQPPLRDAAALQPTERKARAISVGAVAFGAIALGATAIGALAIGSLAIGALAVKRGRVRRMTIDTLEVRRLHVGELTSGSGSEQTANLIYSGGDAPAPLKASMTR
jgi:hypothetical protein